jgi:hypothetical protein
MAREQEILACLLALASGSSAVCLLLLLAIAAITAITTSTAVPSLLATLELKGPRNKIVKTCFF